MKINKMQLFWLIYLFPISSRCFGRSSPIIRSTWLYLELPILSTDIADSWHQLSRGASGGLLRHDHELTVPRSVGNFLSNRGITDSEKKFCSADCVSSRNPGLLKYRKFSFRAVETLWTTHTHTHTTPYGHVHRITNWTQFSTRAKFVTTRGRI